MNYANDKKKTYNEFINSLDIIGLDNAALYLFEKPVTKEELERLEYPDTIKLIAVVKSGNVYVIPESKQKRLMADIFIQREIKIYNKKFVTFPLFYENTFYGLFLCELNNEIYNKGALIANELGMIIHMIKIS